MLGFYFLSVFLCVFTPMCYSCCCLFSPFYLLLGIQYNFESAVRMLSSELCSQPIQRLLDALHTAHPTQASAVPELNKQKKFLENSQPIRIQAGPAGAAWCWRPIPAYFPTEPQKREKQRKYYGRHTITVVTPTCSKTAHCQQGLGSKHRAYSIYSTLYYTSAWFPRSSPFL